MRQHIWALDGASIGAPECRLLDCEYIYLAAKSCGVY
jgi:hypothetical protein